jgi:hypothetical protein
MRHGLLARCLTLGTESRESFDALLALHLERFQPADGVEYTMIEEMVASYWRMRRAWAIETRLLDDQIAAQPGRRDGNELAHIATAFSQLAVSPSLALIHRYETRLHVMYQRALHNLLLLRTVAAPNEPSPDSEHFTDLTALPLPELGEAPADVHEVSDLSPK